MRCIVRKWHSINYCSGTCDMIPDLYFHFMLYTHTIILASQTYKFTNIQVLNCLLVLLQIHVNSWWGINEICFGRRKVNFLDYINAINL